MTAIVRPRVFSGVVKVPPSKSHTIRRLLIAALSDGTSEIENPLDSLDTRSCAGVLRALGAEITETGGRELWKVRGIGKNRACQEPVYCDAGNSGTTLFLGLAAAALGSAQVVFDGDEQLRRRSAGPLLEALAGLGVSVKSAADRGNAASGCVPITVRGPWKGGRVSLPCPTSQYLSALLLAAPLAPPGVVTEIDVPLLNERPYIDMTLSYLKSGGIPYEAAEDYSRFRIAGGGRWKPAAGPVPGDFSSAAFPAAAAIISGGEVTLLGLDKDDTQGDRAFFGILEKMGCRVQWRQTPSRENRSKRCQAPFSFWRLTVSRGAELKGGEFDLNGTPDLLPVLAAFACYARGDTALVNAAHARIKETDRIAVMAEELAKLGVKTTELADGLVIHGSGGMKKPGGSLSANGSLSADGCLSADGRGDHRVVMALAAAALGCAAPVAISGAECADKSYPGFLRLFGAEEA